MKKFLCLLLTLAMVLTLAACGGDKTPSKGDDSALSGTVVIYSTQTDVDHEVFLKIFNEAYPNVKVEFISGSLGELTARVDAEKENPQADVIFGGLSQTDGRADIYSLGVLLNVMLTGQHPSRKLASGKAGHIVQRCTMMNPDQRYQTVWELRDAL